MITIQCQCGYQGSVRDDWRGKKVKCPTCTNPIMVPLEEPKPVLPPKPEPQKTQELSVKLLKNKALHVGEASVTEITYMVIGCFFVIVGVVMGLICPSFAAGIIVYPLTGFLLGMSFFTINLILRYLRRIMNAVEIIAVNQKP